MIEYIEYCYCTAAKIWVIKNQLARRNLTIFQRGELGLILEPLERELAEQRQGARTDIKENFPESQRGQTRDKVAATVGISRRKSVV